MSEVKSFKMVGGDEIVAGLVSVKEIIEGSPISYRLLISIPSHNFLKAIAIHVSSLSCVS